MNILEATISDAENIEKLVNSAYRGDSSKRGWTTEADLLGGIRINTESVYALINDENSKILIFKNNNDLQGCVNITAKDSVLYLGMLTVDPELQNSGIGKKLLRYVEEYALNNSFTSIEMTVISQRTELIAWYERHGFQKTGEKRPFPMDDPKFGVPKTMLEFIVLDKKIK